ncbi:MAG: hydantoinase B/oxoprolinase family protein [Proteobacteria bacterium]|nr:hydantoinase B/oxoprolinase family protein [Pseudomonadota bacterium]
MHTWVDRGGTFTDVVTRTEQGHLTTAKVPSDRAVVGDLARGRLSFGTTVATNALLERGGVPTLLVVTEGFADLVTIGDMSRPELFDPDANWPRPLCTRVVEVRGRLDVGGNELEPLELPALDMQGIESVAIVLLHSGTNGVHERRMAEHIEASRPGLFVSQGHLCSPERGYLARIETTLVDAAITPVLSAAMQRDKIPGGALAIRSDASLVDAAQLRGPDAVLSGPAGGVLAVRAVAALAGFDKAVGLDMGGTSTDVCRVEGASLPRRRGDVRVAGLRLRRPILEVETIAAGGGSILTNDGLSLGVGPRSAGAHPGPQCYGRGGPPTLTDAALAAGLVDPLAFDPPLDVEAVKLPGSADAFLDVARDRMAAAVKKLAAAHGADLREHALVSYGGAAGQHAAFVAERLGIATVLVHPCSAVLCAWGQSLAREEDVATASVWQPLKHMSPLETAWAGLEAVLPVRAVMLRSVELRFAGTDDSIEVMGTTVTALEQAFHQAHKRRYGFERTGVIEVVNARVRSVAESADPLPTDADPFGLGDAIIAGPDLVTLPTTRIVVPAGWTAQQSSGLLVLTHRQRQPAPQPTERTPYGVSLWSSRFMAVAEQSGAVLQRLARSVNIRERLDFSCAVFDGQGQLIANAPHIPVHLGAMGETVRDLIRSRADLPDGQAWLCNDPSAGGSHLPDLTVVTAVHAGSERWFVASRGHHVDVGGTTPGSMPPRSRSLAEEGFVVRHVPLLEEGRLRTLREIDASRQADVVRADLLAQVAANAHAASALKQLGPADVVSCWMAHLLDVAEESVARRIADIATGAASDQMDGLKLEMALRRDHNGLVFDLSGTEGPHRGNLNAPSAVVRSAILYSLRVLVAEPIPLNEGALRNVHILCPKPSLVAPPEGAAVAGGNVETSMRLVDLILRATSSRAASQGTMNNLTIGGEGWSLYETLGGGTGATPEHAGRSAGQVHMTNTRATDPEVVESRLPLRVWQMAVRRSSGGTGEHLGGDGLIRELELCEPGTACLLATRRAEGPAGLHGGSAGEPGLDELYVEGRWVPWSGDAVRLAAGDRVRVSTPGGGGCGLTPR